MRAKRSELRFRAIGWRFEEAQSYLEAKEVGELAVERSRKIPLFVRQRSLTAEASRSPLRLFQAAPPHPRVKRVKYKYIALSPPSLSNQ